MKKPYFMGRFDAHRNHGSFYARAVLLLTALTFLLSSPQLALAADGAREALELRYQAELAIAEERARGGRELADAMEEHLSGLLQEYLVTRDGTIALDTVDAAFVEEQFKVARAMEEPGVALALDVFSGPGTGYENELRTALSNLADFHVERAERIAERVSSHGVREWSDTAKDRTSDAALDSYERQMERQRDRVEQVLLRGDTLAAEFDGRFEAQLEAKLDATTDRFQTETPPTIDTRSEAILTRTETAVQAVVEQTEAKVENVLNVLEQKIEANPDKIESAVEKTQSRIESIVSQAEQKIEGIVTRADEKIARIVTSSTDSTADPAPADATPKETGGKKPK